MENNENLWCCSLETNCPCRNCKKPECNKNEKSVFLYNSTKTGKCCNKWTCVTKLEGITTAESTKATSIAFSYTSSQYNTNMDPTVTTMDSRTDASNTVSSTTSNYYKLMGYKSTRRHYVTTSGPTVQNPTKVSKELAMPMETISKLEVKSPPAPATDGSGISTVMIVIIVICVVVVAILVIGGLIFWLLKRKQKKTVKAKKTPVEKNHSLSEQSECPNEVRLSKNSAFLIRMIEKDMKR